MVFLTGTRADFGKLKSLIQITQKSENYEVHIFATGMHMNFKYGSTVDEIKKSGFNNIYKYINHDTVDHMDRTLAKTIDGFSHYIAQVKPDLVVVHGDRVEAMAGTIVASLNNILVTHIEGGEISGTIDELIRHAVSKMSHIHLVANEKARKRLLQLGELEEAIHVIGSPDLDLMKSELLPRLSDVKKHYEITFKKFSIAIFHPVTTEHDKTREHTRNLIDAMIESKLNYIVIYPNNDLGSDEILSEYENIKNNRRFRIYPSLRFEYFLSLLKNSDFIIGNSSAGVREAPFYNIPAIDIGSRQLNRSKAKTITHCDYTKENIKNAIENISNHKYRHDSPANHFGDGKSAEKFIKLLDSGKLWKIKHQKQFKEI